MGNMLAEVSNQNAENYEGRKRTVNHFTLAKFSRKLLPTAAMFLKTLAWVPCRS